MLQKIHEYLRSHRYLIFLLFLIHTYATYSSLKLYSSFISIFPWYLKIFVPTCTFAIGMFAIAYYFYFKNGNVPNILAIYCVVAGISYGLIMVLLYPALASFIGWTDYYITQTIIHLLFALESLLFIRFTKNSTITSILIVFGWFMLKSFTDLYFKTSQYIYKTYPHILSKNKFIVYLLLNVIQILVFVFIFKLNKQFFKKQYLIYKNKFKF